jgi:hypothetical protein
MPALEREVRLKCLTELSRVVGSDLETLNEYVAAEALSRNAGGSNVGFFQLARTFEQRIDQACRSGNTSRSRELVQSWRRAEAARTEMVGSHYSPNPISFGMPETDARGSMVFLLAYTNAALQVLSDDGQHASAPYSKVTARYGNPPLHMARMGEPRRMEVKVGVPNGSVAYWLESLWDVSPWLVDKNRPDIQSVLKDRGVHITG